MSQVKEGKEKGGREGKAQGETREGRKEGAGKEGVGEGKSSGPLLQGDARDRSNIIISEHARAVEA